MRRNERLVVNPFDSDSVLTDLSDDTLWEENQIAHERWCNHLAAQFLCVFVLDRFSDFVSDQVTAPVRETISQTMGSLLLHMPRRSVTWVHSILLDMIKQDFVLSTTTNGNGEFMRSKFRAVG